MLAEGGEKCDLLCISTIEEKVYVDVEHDEVTYSASRIGESLFGSGS